ncbi:mechanosensitive ion channel family protein [Fodinibius halophilus]|uniref:Mechanosensitive ion channel n=1 Tax=Fodinibius halophilus TaxID=1736908 RepID=A0A6M1T4L0_9BACT|nr:mechanosensitive ion channel domain-containing protein [Fodinibius halophilus]NGP88185.1 mechanosensitive ion channel [Fodinibius halophilus]
MQRILLSLFLLLLGTFGSVSAKNIASFQQQQDTVTIVGPIQVDTAGTSKATDDTTASVPDDAESTLKEFKNLISFGSILGIIILLIITYFANKLVVIILDNLSERFTNYRLGIKRTVPVFRLFIWVFALYVIIAGVINPPVGTVLTVLASVGIAVGFAAQDILKNIFGGFMIILDRPFQVGDKIEVGNYYGEVLAIGLRSSRVVTPDDSIVSIPNGELMNKAVSNANAGALDCMVVAEIFLPMDVDVEAVKRIAYKAVVSSRYVYLQKPVSVIMLNEVHEENFIVKLRVKAYVLDIRYEFPFKSDMTELILRELKERNLIPKQAINYH